MRKSCAVFPLALVAMLVSCPMEPPGFATSLSPKAVVLSWEPRSGATKYEIHVDGVYREWTEGLRAEVTLLEAATDYVFEVFAVVGTSRVRVLGPSVARTKSLPADDALIDPGRDLEYLGAFKLPAYSGASSSWGFHDGDVAWRPDGDPEGGDDFPGSLFVPGNVTQRFVAEVSIPAPSRSRDIASLPAAATLQEFADIRSPNMPTGPQSHPPALEFLPAGPGVAGGRLYTCFADNYQVGGQRLKSFGSALPTLAAPDVRGGWYVGSTEAYSSPAYMTTTSFIAALPTAPGGFRLAAGGSRYGDYPWGPVLVAFRPWDDTFEQPADGDSLSYLPLLQYDARSGEEWWSEARGKKVLAGAAPNDIWRGCAWIAKGARNVVAMCGIKGQGDYWYVSGAGPRMSNYRSLVLFYDGRDLEAVASGAMSPNEPQPYAVLDLAPFLFSRNENDETWSVKKKGPGAMAFDPERGLLYVVELKVYGSYEDRPIVHVFRLK